MARLTGESTRRLPALAGIALLHLVVYLAVTRLTLLRPPEAFIDPATWLDTHIPHLPATWPLYWLPYVLVPVAGAVAVMRLPRAAFQRLVVVWVAMIITGGIFQVAFPAEAPWPADPAPSQRTFHDSQLILPYATLPSMHVANTALAGAVFGSVFRTHVARIAAVTTTILVAVGTLTLKEHVVLDAGSGLALAGVAWIAWRRGAKEAA